MKSRSGFVPIFIAITAVLVALLVSSGYIVYRQQMAGQLTTNNSQQQPTGNSQQTAQNPNSQSLTPNTSAPSSTIDTSNWKTYTNTQYGFSFKYPNSPAIETSSSFGGFTIEHQQEDHDWTVLHFHFFPGKTPDALLQFKTEYTNPTGEPGIINEKRVSSVGSIDGSLNALLCHIWNYVWESCKTFDPGINELADINKSGATVKSVSVGGIASQVINSGGPHEDFYIIFTPVNGGTLITIEEVQDQTWYCNTVPQIPGCNTDPDKVAGYFPDAILSTFKFFSPSSATDISGWKTYTNTQYGFSFKYPALGSKQQITEGCGSSSGCFQFEVWSGKDQYFIPEINIGVSTSTGSTSLDSWFEKTFGSDCSLLSSGTFVHKNLSNGMDMLTDWSPDAKPFPSCYQDGPISPYFATSPDRTLVISMSLSQVLDLDLRGYDTGQKMHDLMEQILPTFKFTPSTLLGTGTPSSSADELLKEGRDEERIGDMSILKSAILVYLAASENPHICPQAKIYRSDKGSNMVDGSGWLPINFKNTPSGSVLGTLPMDPVSSGSFVYSYTCDPSSQSFELSANMESTKYGNGGSKDVESTDGGVNPNAYEIGTNLKLLK